MSPRTEPFSITLGTSTLPSIEPVSLTESVAVTYNDFRWVIFTAIAVKLALPDKSDE